MHKSVKFSHVRKLEMPPVGFDDMNCPSCTIIPTEIYAEYIGAIKKILCQGLYVLDQCNWAWRSKRPV